MPRIGVPLSAHGFPVEYNTEICRPFRFGIMG